MLHCSILVSCEMVAAQKSSIKNAMQGNDMGDIHISRLNRTTLCCSVMLVETCKAETHTVNVVDKYITATIKTSSKIPPLTPV